jgi:hypothetical protein
MWQIKLFRGKQPITSLVRYFKKTFDINSFRCPSLFYSSQNHGQASTRAITQDIVSTRFPNKTCMFDYLSQLVARIG